MARYIDLKIGAKIKGDVIKNDLVLLLHFLRIALTLFSRALFTAIIILLVIGLFPNTINSFDISDFFSEVLKRASNLVPALLLIGVLLLASKKVRGTLKHFVIMDKEFPENSWLRIFRLLMTCIILLLFSFYPDLLGIPSEPIAFRVIGGYYFAASLVVLVVYKTLNEFNPENGVLQTDTLLEDPEELSGDQHSTLDDLYKLISQEPKIRSIGLYGDWGSGKTTVYNMAKEAVTKNNPEILWLDFKPWKYTSQEALVLGFYSEIGTLLETKIDGKQNSISKLLEESDPLVKKHDKTGYLTILASFLRRHLSGGGKSSEFVEKILRHNGKRLIISIDNAERGHDVAQINRALQLVHELSICGLVTYVFIAEKIALLACLPGHIESRKKNEYLEKFIEHELHIPSPRSPDLRGYLNYLLSKSENSIPENFNLNVRNSTIQDMHSYRGVIKVFNRFIWQLDERFYER